MKNYDNIIICVLIVFFLLFFIISSFIFVKDFITAIIADYNNYKEQYDFSSAVIIDTHIGYSRFGKPVYYFVYKFSSGAIRQVEVHEQLYYEEIQKNTEGS